MRRLKRMVGISPALEWRCGKSWNTDLFKAMGAGEGATIARYQHGNAAWELACESQLHEFKLLCLNHLTTATSDEHELANFPPSFRQACNVKRRWLNDQASDAELQKSIESVTSDTIQIWPSNWCFGANAMFAAKTLVLTSLDDQRSTASAAQCAENLIFYMSLSSACIKMNCHETSESDQFENIEETTNDDGITVRGVACPHMDDAEMENVANNTIDSVALRWRQMLTEELIELLTPQ